MVLHWPELLLVVGPFGDHATWTLSREELVLVQEARRHGGQAGGGYGTQWLQPCRCWL